MYAAMSTCPEVNDGIFSPKCSFEWMFKRCIRIVKLVVDTRFVFGGTEYLAILVKRLSVHGDKTPLISIGQG